MLAGPGAGKPEPGWKGPGLRQSLGPHPTLPRDRGSDLPGTSCAGVLVAEPEIQTGDEDDRVRDRSGYPHDARTELLVGQRRNVTGSPGERGVRIERRGGEGEHGSQRPGRNGAAEDEDHAFELGEARVEWVLVDHLRPEEDAEPQKEAVLEVMDRVVAQREVIGGGPMPEPEIGGGDD